MLRSCRYSSECTPHLAFTQKLSFCAIKQLISLIIPCPFLHISVPLLKEDDVTVATESTTTTEIRTTTPFQPTSKHSNHEFEKDI